MKPITGYHLITPDDLHWRPSNLMKIPNADFLERTGSENMGARLWRMPPQSANTLHKHIRTEEFYFVLEGTGRMRVGDETLTVPRYGGVMVGPDKLRQVFNDTDEEVLWLIIGAPEEMEFLQGSKSQMDARCSHLRRGWYWGRESFAEGLHEIAARAIKRVSSRKYRSSRERLAHDEHQAEKLLAEGLTAAGLRPEELARLPGSDARKVALARCLESGTTVSQSWLAERLQMCSAANVSQQLRRADDMAPLPARLRRFLNSVKF